MQLQTTELLNNNFSKLKSNLTNFDDTKVIKVEPDKCIHKFVLVYNIWYLT